MPYRRWFLFIGTSFYFYSGEYIVPLIPGIEAHFVEFESLLLTVKVLAGILDADERYAHLYLNLFSGFGIVGEEYSYIIARHFFGVPGVDFVLPVIGIPFGLYTGHRSLFFQYPDCRGFLSTRITK